MNDVYAGIYQAKLFFNFHNNVDIVYCRMLFLTVWNNSTLECSQVKGEEMFKLNRTT
jgi:hypothetical protein